MFSAKMPGLCLLTVLGLAGAMADSVWARGGGGGYGGGGARAGGYSGGAVASRSYGGGYYPGSVYSHNVPSAPVPSARVPSVPINAPPVAAVPVGPRPVNPGTVNRANVVVNNNRNYTGIYGGRSGYWWNNRYYNYPVYGGGIYAGGVIPYYAGYGYYGSNGIYYGPGGASDTGAINSGNGAPTMYQAPEQQPLPPQAQPGQSGAVYYPPTPAATVPPRPTPVGGVFEPVVGQSYVQNTPTTAVVSAQQMYYQGTKYYYYGGSYYQAHMQGHDVGYHKIATPDGITDPLADAPKSIITIVTKE